MTSSPFKVTALAMTCGIGLAQARSTPVEFKFASSVPPTWPWAKRLDRTAAQVAEETKVAVKIAPFYSSQQGGENDAIAQISRGRLDMGSFTANSVVLQVPEIALLQLPLFFVGQAQRDCVLDNHMQKHTVEALAKENLVFINWSEAGSVHLRGKKSYATPSDVKGIKIGVVANKMTLIAGARWASTRSPPTWPRSAGRPKPG